MRRETVSNPTTATVSAGTSRVSPNAEQSGPAIQISKADWTHKRIERRAYELYQQGGRQEGQALEDWVNAERQLVCRTAGGAVVLATFDAVVRAVSIK